MLISNWKEVLAKSYTVWVAILAVVLPEVLARLDFLPLDASSKEWIRMVLVAMIPFVRILQQRSLSNPPILKE